MAFVTAQWLAAAGLVVLPIVIHLIHNDRFQRCELATVRFLAAVVRARQGRRQIANWPLLLVRAAALIALAILLARPYFADSTAPEKRATDTFVLVDQSGSQARRNAPDLAKAVDDAVAHLPSDAQITLAQFAEDVVITPQATDLHPRAGAGTNLPRALQWAIDRRLASDRPGRIVLVSDFARTSLLGVSPRLWPRDTAVELVPTGDPGAWNLGIERVELLTPGAVSAVECEVTLRGSGPFPRKPNLVRLHITGVDQPLEQIIPAGQMRARFRWETKIPAEGLLWRGRAELLPFSGDAIAIDDLRPFAFAVARPRTVLLIDGDPGQSVFDGETYYLDQALKAVTRADDVPLFQTTTRARLEDPQGFDVVALCNVASLSADDTAALARYAAAGGSVFLAPGMRTTPEIFQALSRAGIGFGTATRVAAPEFHGGLLTSEEHPALHTLAQGAEDGWRKIAFWNTFQLTPAAGAKVLATFDNGQPLIVESNTLAGGGRALVFLHSVDRQDSEFPREPLYVPWAREMFRYLSRALQPHWKITEAPPSLAESRAPGVYVEGTSVTVVAADAREIDVTPASLDEVRTALGVNQAEGNQPTSSPAQSPLLQQAPDRQRPHEWWPALAVALFVLLLLDGLLSAARPSTPRRIRNGSAVATP